MKITLATIHCNPDFTPLALLYLKAYLVEKKGHLESDVSILECHPATSVDEFVSDILKTKPKRSALHNRVRFRSPHPYAVYHLYF